MRSGSRTKPHEQKPSWKRAEPGEVERRDSFQEEARMSNLLRQLLKKKTHSGNFPVRAGGCCFSSEASQEKLTDALSDFQSQVLN